MASCRTTSPTYADQHDTYHAEKNHFDCEGPASTPMTKLPHGAVLDALTHNKSFFSWNGTPPSDAPFGEFFIGATFTWYKRSSSKAQHESHTAVDFCLCFVYFAFLACGFMCLLGCDNFCFCFVHCFLFNLLMLDFFVYVMICFCSVFSAHIFFVCVYFSMACAVARDTGCFGG